MADDNAAPAAAPADTQEDRKPAQSEHVNLKDGQEVFFKIKRKTMLKKLMETYCERQGKSFNAVRFLNDGERIQPNQTPDELGLEDGDQIEVMIEQLGGC